MTRFQKLSTEAFDTLRKHGFIDEDGALYIQIAKDVLRVEIVPHDEKGKSIGILCRFMGAAKDWNHRHLTTHAFHDLVFRIKNMARSELIAA